MPNHRRLVCLWRFERNARIFPRLALRGFLHDGLGGGHPGDPWVGRQVFALGPYVRNAGHRQGHKGRLGFFDPPVLSPATLPTTAAFYELWTLAHVGLPRAA